MGTTAQIATAIVALAAVGLGQPRAVQPSEQPAQQPEQPPQQDVPASSFVSLKLDGACDDKNDRLWLTNAHTYRSIATTVRWRADGGKDLTEQFFPGPGIVWEIGCAAEGQILDAAFADF